MKLNKGLTLISLVVTIIVMVILVGVILLFITAENGVIKRAEDAKQKADITEYKEKIRLEYSGLKISEKKKETIEVFEELEEKMNLNSEFKCSEFMIIKKDKDMFFTLFEDGTIIDGKKTILYIENGNIEIRAKGYIQGENELVENDGDYIITGISDKYSVNIKEKGNYNIIIWNLNINLSSNGGIPLNLNGANAKTDLNVNLSIEGKNFLIGSGPGIRFARAEPNINGTTSGSTLIIEGTGSVYTEGGSWSAGIGNSYTDGIVANIIINSGNITAVGGSNGCGIGGGLRANVSNIIINGGNITAKSSNRHAIGASAEGVLNNLIINGGNLILTGSEYGGALGGGRGSEKIVINGGTIEAKHNITHGWDDATIGDGCKGLEINGGMINSYSAYGMGIGNMNALPFKLSINGGNLIVNDRICSMPVNLTNGILYQVKLKIEGLSGNSKITDIKTNNNIKYEVENLYTSRDGHLYMFSPEGNVTVEVTSGGKKYKGIANVTSSNTEIFNLSVIE